MAVSRNAFIVFAVIYAALMLEALTHVVWDGRVGATIALMVIASPGYIFVVWFFAQDRQPGHFDLRQISYSGAIGDFLLPIMMGFAAKGWQLAGDKLADSILSSQWWVGLSFMVGLGGGYLFHRMGGASDINSPILAERLHDSPATWAHNFGIFPALFGSAFCVIVPLLFVPEGRWYGVWALAIGVVLWGGLVGVDWARDKFLPDGHPWKINFQWLDAYLRRNGRPVWPWYLFGR